MLIVDDTPDVLESLTDLVSMCPLFRVGGVASCGEAERLIRRSGPYHACVLDLGIRDRENDELYLLRTYGRKTAFVIVTASHDPRKGFDRKELGACDLLVKPVETRRLMPTLLRNGLFALIGGHGVDMIGTTFGRAPRLIVEGTTRPPLRHPATNYHSKTALIVMIQHSGRPVHPYGTTLVQRSWSITGGGRMGAVSWNYRRISRALMKRTLTLTVGAAQVAAFTHPGLVNTRSDLDFAKSMVKAGTSPWAGAFSKVKSENNYLSHTPQAMADVYCAAYRRDDGQRNKLTADAEIVYGCALIWYIEGDRRYADKGIQILNAWSSTMKQYSGSDAPLVAGYGPPPMIWGAEILRYSNAGWRDADISRFSTWLDITWNLVQKGSGNNPNWQQWMACCALSIAVFQDNDGRWDRALQLWHGKIGTTIKSDGKPGEWGRDLWHAQMGIAPAAYGAEIAWSQGLDLYKEVNGDNRILLGTEYVADCLANGRCSGTSDVDKGPWPYYQWVYNHYVNRRGLKAPNALKLIQRNNSAYSGGFEKFARGGWGTLTHNRKGGTVSVAWAGRPGRSASHNAEQSTVRIHDVRGRRVTIHPASAGHGLVSHAREASVLYIVTGPDGAILRANILPGR